MANNYASNPMFIEDNGGGGVVTTNRYFIRKIRWVGGTTAGHAVTIKNKDDQVIWNSVAVAANFVDDSDLWGTRLDGLKITGPGSGFVYIYYE